MLGDFLSQKKNAVKYGNCRIIRNLQNDNQCLNKIEIDLPVSFLISTEVYLSPFSSKQQQLQNNSRKNLTFEV